jgi:hypothetical protein
VRIFGFGVGDPEGLFIATEGVEFILALLSAEMIVVLHDVEIVLSGDGSDLNPPCFPCEFAGVV